MKVDNSPSKQCWWKRRSISNASFFLSFAIDDAARAPVIIFAGGGGTESRSALLQRGEFLAMWIADLSDQPLTKPSFPAAFHRRTRSNLATRFENYSLPRAALKRVRWKSTAVLTKSGEFVAADCRITIDDYAVVRHPELGIEIAREFDHPPTALERFAYAVEQNDHRGTFYFAQLATTAAKASKGLVGFHGAGGGGSMMSMDAIVNAGFTIANFTDTSGNPSASKVYRAARIILAQRIWSAISVPAPASRARNNIGLPTGWPRHLGTRSRHSRSYSFRGATPKTAPWTFCDGYQNSFACRSRAIVRPIRPP